MIKVEKEIVEMDLIEVSVEEVEMLVEGFNEI